VINHSNANQAKWRNKEGVWTIPANVLPEAARVTGHGEAVLKDAWGQPIRLVKLDKKRDDPKLAEQFRQYELVSAGPDGKFGTADDVKLAETPIDHWVETHVWYFGDAQRAKWLQGQQGQLAHRRRLRGLDDAFMLQNHFGGFPGGRGGFPMAPGLPNAGVPVAKAAAEGKPVPDGAGKADEKDKTALTDPTAPAGAPAVRLREYFPETLLWQPGLITDDKGVAVLPLTFADSITTWRLTASASSRGGLLGGTTTPLRVFQDFFVDLDLPLNLTQNDEVAFPVAVYNYLKTPQTVKLELQPAPWFELTDGAGLTRTLDLKASEVTAVKFRIRAKSIGFQPLTVKATGTTMSDALKRVIEVVPDGKKVEQVLSDRLAGRVTQTVTIPGNALPDASKLLVKIYPGVMSQVLEGTEGMLRLPGG
jgi:hypothetical protein